MALVERIGVMKSAHSSCMSGIVGTVGAYAIGVLRFYDNRLLVNLNTITNNLGPI